MITIVKGDCWIGVYVNDNLVYEGHDITPDEILNIAGIKYNKVHAYNFLDENGCCPFSLKEVVKDEESS